MLAVMDKWYQGTDVPSTWVCIPTKGIPNPSVGTQHSVEHAGTIELKWEAGFCLLKNDSVVNKFLGTGYPGTR